MGGVSVVSGQRMHHTPTPRVSAAVPVLAAAVRG